jgi:hypothetical protein
VYVLISIPWKHCCIRFSWNFHIVAIMVWGCPGPESVSVFKDKHATELFLKSTDTVPTFYFFQFQGCCPVFLFFVSCGFSCQLFRLQMGLRELELDKQGEKNGSKRTSVFCNPSSKVNNEKSETANACGISVPSVYKIKKEMKETGFIRTPGKKRPVAKGTRTRKQIYDELTLNSI